jgi:hypothetical protein
MRERTRAQPTDVARSSRWVRTVGSAQRGHRARPPGRSGESPPGATHPARTRNDQDRHAAGGGPSTALIIFRLPTPRAGGRPARECPLHRPNSQRGRCPPRSRRRAFRRGREHTRGRSTRRPRPAGPARSVRGGEAGAAKVAGPHGGDTGGTHCPPVERGERLADPRVAAPLPSCPGGDHSATGHHALPGIGRRIRPSPSGTGAGMQTGRARGHGNCGGMFHRL